MAFGWLEKFKREKAAVTVPQTPQETPEQRLNWAFEQHYDYGVLNALKDHPELRTGATAQRIVNNLSELMKNGTGAGKHVAEALALCPLEPDTKAELHAAADKFARNSLEQKGNDKGVYFLLSLADKPHHIGEHDAIVTEYLPLMARAFEEKHNPAYPNHALNYMAEHVLAFASENPAATASLVSPKMIEQIFKNARDIYGQLGAEAEDPMEDKVTIGRANSLMPYFNGEQLNAAISGTASLASKNYGPYGAEEMGEVIRNSVGVLRDEQERRARYVVERNPAVTRKAAAQPQKPPTL